MLETLVAAVHSWMRSARPSRGALGHPAQQCEHLDDREAALTEEDPAWRWFPGRHRPCRTVRAIACAWDRTVVVREAEGTSASTVAGGALLVDDGGNITLERDGTVLCGCAARRNVAAPAERAMATTNPRVMATVGTPPASRSGGYSCRRAIIGSMSEARRAGTKHASVATAARISDTAATVAM